jgi:hypothetical protein
MGLFMYMFKGLLSWIFTLLIIAALIMCLAVPIAKSAFGNLEEIPKENAARKRDGKLDMGIRYNSLGKI